MIKIVLVLLYVWSGQLKLEQIPMASMSDCMEKAPIIMEKQKRDPRFDDGLFAACMPLKVQEAAQK